MGVELRRPALITQEVDLTKFNSGKSALDDWLRDHAWQGQTSRTANTFLHQTRENDIVGYYSLSMGSISHDEATQRIRKGTRRHPIPVLLLARLAIDQHFQGQGYGRALLRDVVIRAVNISTDVAFRAILTHPIDKGAFDFYRKYGFEPSPISPGQLMILIKDVRKALGIENNMR